MCLIKPLESTLLYIPMFIIFHVLYSSLYLLSFSEEKFSIDGKKQELEKEENNNTRATNAEREREERTRLVIPILHETHTYRLVVNSLELVNLVAMTWQHNDNVL